MIPSEQDRREWLTVIRSAPCKTCGQQSEAPLVFSPYYGERLFRISSKYLTCSWDRIIAEVAKCIPECRTCSHLRNALRQQLMYARKYKKEVIIKPPRTDAERIIQDQELLRHDGPVELPQDIAAFYKAFQKASGGAP